MKPPHIIGPQDVMWIALILAGAIVMLTALESRGHGPDAQWILEKYPACCGPEDCEMVMGRVRAVVHNGSGVKEYSVDGMKGSLPASLVLKSEDGLPWACQDLTDNYIRCLFLPKTNGFVDVEEVGGWSVASTPG